MPFVPIMQNGNTEVMIREAARSLRQAPAMSDFEPLLGFFANFVLDSALVQQILRWDMVILEESPWYNEILRRGEVRGRQEEASRFVLRLLTLRLGSIAPAVETQIQGFPLDRLETLGEVLLDFSNVDDLMHWLQ